MNSERPGLYSLSGTLFDYYPESRAMILWIVAEDGKRVRLRHAFEPTFFVRGEKARLRKFLERVERSTVARVLGPTERRDFWSGQSVEVEECAITDMTAFQPVMSRFWRAFPDLDFFNCDLLPAQHYGYATGLFPCARGRFSFGGEGRLLSWELADDPWTTDYALPDLRILRLEGETPIRGVGLLSLRVEMDGSVYEFESGSIASMLREFARLLERYDPDVILSKGGDSRLFPFLLAASEKNGIELPLDREPVKRRVVLDGRSYFSYGRVLYQAPDYPLYGRWHLDQENSFLCGEAGLDGLVEAARVSQIPVQRMGRRSIGTGITSIQLSLAFREGFLIPWKKARPESWKSAWQLLHTDRGGLVYQPIVGFHEDVYELDFVSMYPTIMSDFNVSPETVNCSCCQNETVPGIGYAICGKRSGLISRCLAPMLRKRREYKARMKRLTGEEREKLNRRQGALKWLLVCCFGYLGYRNARFGRIEAHEAVCAYSREKLIRAREVAEEHGFRVLHAIVDCIWIRKPGSSPEEIERLCRAIDAATGLTIAIEGHYRWIQFLPSIPDPKKPVPNRFFGLFEDGTFKQRGIELRRRDQPRFVKDLQEALIQDLAGACTFEAYRAMAPRLLERIRETVERLQSGEIPVSDLLIVRRITRKPEEYRNNSPSALAARQGARAGLPLHVGENIAYLIRDASHPDPSQRVCLAPLIGPDTPYDTDRYIDLLCRAAATVLHAVGMNARDIRKWLDAGEMEKEENASRNPFPDPEEEKRMRPLFSGLKW